MRYITIPSPIRIFDATGSTTAMSDPVPFAQAVRAVCLSIIQHGNLDSLAVLDLRDKFERAKDGDCVELTEPEYEAIEKEFRRPKSLAPAYVMSARPHLQAVFDAPREKPATAQISANGATAS